MARKRFDDEQDEHPSSEAPRKAPFSCVAAGCPMTGAIFPGGAREGVCGWHYGVNGAHWPRVTQTLTDWTCLTYEINVARRSLIGIDAANPAQLLAKLAEAVERLRPAVHGGGWGDVFEARPGEGYGDWTRRMERFLGERVHQSLSSQEQLR